MTLEESKILFKNTIKSVEIGLHNYCNRTCDYCPLSRIDVNRNDSRMVKYMSDDIFFNILEDLKSIDFDGVINLSRYFEPLSEKDYIIKRVRQMKEYLPDSTIRLNTNCDYLNRRYLDELLDAGVDSFSLQAYLKNGSTEFNKDEMIKRMNIILRKIKIDKVITEEEYDILAEKNKNYIRYKIPELKSTIYAQNFWEIGVNRAGSITSTPGAEIEYKRTDPCTKFDSGIYVDYDGSMTICCDMLAPEIHRDWIVGDLRKEPNLFLNYGSDYYQGFKKEVNTANFREGSPCITCRRNVSHKTTGPLK